ncbi:gonadotropin-releasing hormone receptor-like [Cimex lectularius]|uniref:G-protein coupled receptors family 1 profile domain-containing protein n=1 Tax=Cimex lectularius TaxID=79782 RepID=A0A8I6SRP2_CIMLE|nr:gonadotropin-releasing hormone receptor-like [Cimex lectularius]
MRMNDPSGRSDRRWQVRIAARTRQQVCSEPDFEVSSCNMEELPILKIMEDNETYTDNCTYNCTNMTSLELPADLRFNDNALLVVIAYSVLFVIAAIGNLTVFITLIRGRHRKSRISLMITHLAIADLFVTFFMIPLEIGWRLTTQWVAGNVACKFCLFLRAFGLYLSSNVLVCVSVDRYFAILHPLRVNDARRRGKLMLALAWILSLICALPQVSMSWVYLKTCLLRTVLLDLS